MTAKEKTNSFTIKGIAFLTWYVKCTSILSTHFQNGLNVIVELFTLLELTCHFYFAPLSSSVFSINLNQCFIYREWKK